MKTTKLLAWSLVLCVGVRVLAVDDSWTNLISGAWQTAGNWSGGAPSNNFSTLYITNATTKTVTIDATTTNFPTTMTISNLVLSAPAGSVNTLFLNNAGLTTPLRILRAFDINEGGVLQVSNSILRVDSGSLSVDGSVLLQSGVITSSVQSVFGTTGSGSLTILDGSFVQSSGTLTLGMSVGSTGTILLTGGQLIATNNSIYIGMNGMGQVTVSNGLFLSQILNVGNNPGASGTLTITGGTNLWTLASYVGFNVRSTGTVWLTGGQLIATNNDTYIGYSGVGQMTVSNGLSQGATLTVGYNIGSVGTLTIAGGTNRWSSNFRVGYNADSTGTVWLTGGQFIVTNTVSYIGSTGVGQMTVSNGLFLSYSTYVGVAAGSQGTLTIAGGTNLIANQLFIGHTATATGVVLVSDGTLAVTNATGTGVLSAGNAGRGTYTQIGGSVIVDRLFVTNGANSVFALNGGTFTIRNGATIDNGSVFSVGSQAGNAATLNLIGGSNKFETLNVGVLAGATGTVLVTGGQLTVTNSFSYIGRFGIGQMTVSNGTWLARDVHVGAQAGSQGTLTIAGGANQLFGTLIVGGETGAIGAVWLTSGQLTVTNDFNYIGYSGNGLMTVSNGAWLARDVVVGTSAGSQGTLTIAGGTNQFSSDLSVGYNAGATGTVWLTGGQLIVTNTSSYIGFSGIGQMTVSNGAWLARDVVVGTSAGSQGTLTIAGGTNQFSLILYLGYNAGATGTVWLTGGQLIVTNTSSYIGRFGIGQMTVSNGTWLARDVYVGRIAGSQGTLIIAGGSSVARTVTVASLSGAVGTLTMAGGALTVDSLVITNSGGGVVFNAGTLTSQGTAINNGQPFAIGDGGGDTATLYLPGGTHTFANGLVINSDGRLLGALTLNDSLSNGGQVIATNGELRLQGPISGSGLYRVASAGTTLSFVGGGSAGALINNGGTVRYESAITHDGPIANSGAILIGPDGTIGVLAMSAGSITGNGSILITPTGALRLGADVAAVANLVTNQGVLQALAGVFGFNGGLANESAYTVAGSQLVTIQNGLANSGGITLQPGGALSVNAVSLQNGSIVLNNAAQMSVGAAWTNTGPISVQGGYLTGATLNNADLIAGYGAVSAPLVNQAGGTVRASGGLLSLNGASLQNSGAFEIESGATLRAGKPLANAGVINNLGGVLDMQTAVLTNNGVLTGWGSFKPQQTVNTGRVLLQGGQADIYGAYLNAAGSTTTVLRITANFFGAFTNAAGAFFKNTGSQVTFFGIASIGGTYVSDPAMNTFNSALTLSGVLAGGPGDVFVFNDDFTSTNPDGLQLAGAKVVFNAGAHTFTLTGPASIGELELQNGASILLAGGDLIVGLLSAQTNQFTTAQTIYYDPAQNPSLGAQTYALNGGGSLTAVPEPSSALLVLFGVVAAFTAARRHRQR
jgi:T5SS/PEP-CTERM-associated repeat protein